jgi:hypothetical protein
MHLRPHVLYGTYEAKPGATDDALVVPAVDGPKPLSATSRSGRSQVVPAGGGRNADRLKSFPRIGPQLRSKTQGAAGSWRPPVAKT